MDSPDNASRQTSIDDCPDAATGARRVCPVCAGQLMEIRGKLQCTACHTICETCCEGGRM
jgi:hypothetical protein